MRVIWTTRPGHLEPGRGHLVILSSRQPGNWSPGTRPRSSGHLVIWSSGHLVIWLSGHPAARGRPDPQNRRFPVGQKIIYKKPRCGTSLGRINPRYPRTRPFQGRRSGCRAGRGGRSLTKLSPARNPYLLNRGTSRWTLEFMCYHTVRLVDFLWPEAQVHQDPGLRPSRQKNSDARAFLSPTSTLAKQRHNKLTSKM